MNRDSQQYKEAFYRFRKSMQRKTLDSAYKDEDIRAQLTGFRDINVVFIYTYRAGKLFAETTDHDRPLFVIPAASAYWSTDDFLVAEEGLFEDYYIHHYENHKR